MLTASYMCVPHEDLRTVTASEWIESIPLDAPTVIAAGSFIRYQYLNYDGFCPLPECIAREAA